MAYPTAVLQAHKVGKSPKKFRTAAGMREAKAKHSLPKKLYQKTAALRNDGTPMSGAAIRIDSFFDEIEKSAGLKRKILKFLTGYLIAKALWGKKGQGGIAGSAPQDMRSMMMGMSMGLRGAGAGAPARGGVPEMMREDIRPFEQQMSRIEADLQKSAALGMDLRTNGPGGVKRPPFPTEGSAAHAYKQFNQSRRVGQSMAVKPPKPNIRAVTSLPG